MKKLLSFVVAIMALISLASGEQKQNRETVAVFVRNASSNSVVEKCLPAFEGALCSKINEMGFSAMNRNVIITELSKYSTSSSSDVLSAIEKVRKMLEGSSKGSENLYDSASMLNVAKMLGADYILDAQISSLASDVRSYSDLNSKTLTTRTIMRATYSLYEAGSGAGAAGKSVKSDYVIRQSENLAIDNSDISNELVESIADQIARELVAQKQQSSGFIAKVERNFPVQIYCFIEGMKFPHVVVNENGEYIVTSQYIPAEAGGVVVMLDGAAIGNASSASNIPNASKLAKNAEPQITDERYNLNVFELPAGIHNMRFERADLVPYDRMVNVSANMKMFSVYLQMTDEARARWKSDSAFFEGLKRNSKLTDAEVKMLEGLAQAYRNSGFKIDYKTDTDQPVTIQQNSSILPPVIK